MEADMTKVTQGGPQSWSQLSKPVLREGIGWLASKERQ
jgi:hypothetical protein